MSTGDDGAVAVVWADADPPGCTDSRLESVGRSFCADAVIVVTVAANAAASMIAARMQYSLWG
jgi:hypothetical protein